MIFKRRIGRVLVWGLVLLPLVLWLVGGGLDDLPRGRRGAGMQGMLAVGQGAGLVGMAMLSMSFLLSARFRWMEDFFGGLDGVYRTHHRMGLAAFGLLVIHPFALALRFLPSSPERAIGFVFPGHARWAVDVGVYAFWLLVLLVILTLLRRVPYDTWKVTHKALGLVLMGGAVHMWFVESTRGLNVAVAENTGLWLYMTGLIGLGFAGAVYKIIVLPLRPKLRYTVSAVQRLNEEVLEVELQPQEETLDFVPGQFVFVTFHSDDLTREAHPYTLCSPAAAETLTITVKALGDYTRQLYERLSPGVEASIEGPYGRFDYRDGGDRQIWIAGGVGVAPFVSWARNMVHAEDATHEVDFYYCVHDRTDAVYLEEFETIDRILPGVEVVLVCSVEDGHLHARDVEDVEGADIFLCGPARLTYDLRRQFRRRGVPDNRIHFEDFEFR